MVDPLRNPAFIGVQGTGPLAPWMTNGSAGGGINMGTGFPNSDAIRPSFFGMSGTALQGGIGLPSTAVGSSSLFSILAGIFSAAQSWINNLASQLSSSFSGTPSMPAPAAPSAASDPTQTLQDGHLSSVGDPHLGVTGTDPYGNAVDSHFDSMVSHVDLIDTNDFGDGLQISTRVTQPQGPNGATTNASATATMNGGNDAVTMRKDGTVSIRSNGQAVALAPGESALLSGGERVTRNSDGSLSLYESNGAGKTMQTTFSANGSGVDVNSDVHGGVTLGGDLVNGPVARANASRAGGHGQTPFA